MEIKLSSEREAFVQAMIATGRYRNEREVVSAALALLVERDNAKLNRLNAKAGERDNERSAD